MVRTATTSQQGKDDNDKQARQGKDENDKQVRRRDRTSNGMAHAAVYHRHPSKVEGDTSTINTILVRNKNVMMRLFVMPVYSN
jgi:hypothetical protein